MNGSFDCGSQCLGLSLHSSAPIAAAGLVTGAVQVWKYSDVGTEALPGSKKRARAHDSLDCVLVKEDAITFEKSCRETKFVRSGSSIAAGSKTKEIKVLDTESLKCISSFKNAHGSAVNCIEEIEEDVLVSGDDDGEVCIWDLRMSKEASREKDLEDYISDFSFDKDRTALLVAGGDSTLGVYNLKKGLRNLDPSERSLPQDADLLSLCPIRSGKKVVAGTQDGLLLFWTWGEWLNPSDRFPGHPESIESILKLDESTIITGSSDGIMRVIGIFPHKLLGVLGDHMDFPIEKMEWGVNHSVIASISHDNLVRFWDASVLKDEPSSDDEDDSNKDEEEGKQEEERDVDEGEKSKTSKKPDCLKGKALKKESKKKAKKIVDKSSEFYSDM